MHLVLDKRCGQAQIGTMPYAIDTAATIADLESAGVEPSQAKAIVQAINGAAGDPVSKEDFRELRGEFGVLDGEFGELRGEFGVLDGKFGELRGEFGVLDGKFGELRGEFGELRSAFGVLEGKFGVLEGKFGVLEGKFGELRGEFGVLEGKFEELRKEVNRRFEEMDRRFAELREEMDRKFATKADLAILKSQLTFRIFASQVATATLLFMLLKFFA